MDIMQQFIDIITAYTMYLCFRTSCADPESLVRGGPTLTTCFVLSLVITIFLS